MAWDFSTDPDFQRELDWIQDLVTEEIEPLDLIRDRLSADGAAPPMPTPPVRESDAE